MLEAKLAAVRPRILSGESGEPLLLEDEVRRYLDDGAKGAIALIGPPGSGKTTALRHLAAVLPAGRVVLLDVTEAANVPKAASRTLTIYATEELIFSIRHVAKLRLASWSCDDLIEYLLAQHKDRCASVLARVRETDYPLIGGSPQLWRLFLDELADDVTLAGFAPALHRNLERRLGDASLIERGRTFCLNSFARIGKPPPLPAEEVDSIDLPGTLRCLLRHGPVQLLLAAERLAADLQQENNAGYLTRRLPRELIAATAEIIGADPQPRQQLAKLFERPLRQAMAASLLLALDPAWVPPETIASLEGAYLPNARWPAVQLDRVNLADADLSKADLRAAILRECNVARSNFRSALLKGANLARVAGQHADFSYADLSTGCAKQADFQSASFVGASLAGAMLAEANFKHANLTYASFQAADLRKADLRHTAIEGASFSAADLSQAELRGLRLHVADFTGARFTQADMNGCNLEDMHLPHTDFQGADLDGALLTGTRMPGANFRGADLRNTGLADIDWEGADLRNADLSGASFHLGSSRSGLVGSPIACEGSRMGFYTDDYEEQHYKAPEEVRKANLRGADLRGARIENVDFYLVDLRAAKLDSAQIAHVRHCRAILDRV